MPGSEAADGPTGELEALEEAVGGLVERYVELRSRVEDAERSRERLEEALEGSGDGNGGGVPPAERLEELGEENRRLRETIEEARRRAERIRSRLIMMEDEVSS